MTVLPLSSRALGRGDLHRAVMVSAVPINMVPAGMLDVNRAVQILAAVVEIPTSLCSSQ